MSGQLPPADWYPDPGDPGRKRYWDGTQWTSETRQIHDAPPPPPQGPPPGQTFAPPPPSGAPAPAPAYVSGPVPQGPSAPSGMSTTAKVLIALGVATVVLLGGCVALLAVARNAAEDAADEQEVSAFVPEVENAPDDQATEATVDAGSEPVDDGADGAEAGGQSADSGPGTRQDPLPYDQTVTLTWDTFGDADGSVWETTIGRPTDIGSDIMAANEFNAEPPEGVVFAGFPVTMTLLEADKEPLSTGFNFTWEILGGATAAAYDGFTIETESLGCGVVPEEFGDFDEVFVSGTLSGTVCIPIPAQDLDHPDTRTALHFAATDSRIVFGE